MSNRDFVTPRRWWFDGERFIFNEMPKSGPRARIGDSQRVAHANLRAKRLGIPGRLTCADWRALKLRYGSRCLACGNPESEVRLAIDHIVSLSMGGPNDISNIQILCVNCNARKAKAVIDYRPSEVA